MPEDPISSFSSDDAIEVVPSYTLAGCSCIGFYAVCLCGGAQYMRGQPAHLLAVVRCQSDRAADAARNHLLSSMALGQHGSHPTMDGGMHAASSDRHARFAMQIQAAAPLSIPSHAASAAAHRFPDDLPRAVSEACRLVFSPPRTQAGSQAIDVSPPPHGNESGSQQQGSHSVALTAAYSLPTSEAFDASP